MFKDSTEEGFGETVGRIPTGAKFGNGIIYNSLLENPHFHRTYDYGSSGSTL
jgi:hypothetical protein